MTSTDENKSWNASWTVWGLFLSIYLLVYMKMVAIIINNVRFNLDIK